MKHRFEKLLENRQLDLQDGFTLNKRLTNAVPSPGGEGQDEGGRHNIFQISIYFKTFPSVIAAVNRQTLR
jgi:hypothetical protein